MDSRLFEAGEKNGGGGGRERIVKRGEQGKVQSKFRKTPVLLGIFIASFTKINFLTSSG